MHRLKVRMLPFLGLVLLGIIGMTGCSFNGYDFIDTNYHFDYAYISLPNGECVEGEIVSWSDTGDGEQITITLINGDRYLCSSYNCVLVEHN